MKKTMRKHKLLITLLLGLACVVPAIASSEEFGGFGTAVAQIYDEESPNNLGGVVVLHVFPDSEAEKAGMRAGDIIVEVDGKETGGRTFRDIVLNSLRGDVGSSSTVKVKRIEQDALITMTVNRALISFPAKPAN